MKALVMGVILAVAAILGIGVEWAWAHAAKVNITREESKPKTVAAELGITPGNAAVRLHRARHALRLRLQTTCGMCTEHGCLECVCRKPKDSGGLPRV